MKDEKEIVYLAKLYNSKACPDPMNLKIKSSPMCKKDFERHLDSPENSKEFNEWFKMLIELGIFVYSGDINIKFMKTKGYKINASKLDNYARNNKYYYDLSNLMNRDRIL